MPDRVFSAWIYSNVDEKKGVVESYEFRSIAIEEEKNGYDERGYITSHKRNGRT